MRTLDSTITQNCGWFLLSFLTVLFSTFPSHSKAQDGDISLDLILEPQLTSAQMLSLSNLGVNRSGQGAPLFNLIIRNNESVAQTDLYMNIQIRSNRVGLIADLYQESGRPFSLRPNQVVTGNNNQLQDGLPGVAETFGFDGGLTDGGEEFINSFEGSTRLPADIYTVFLGIYQGNNSRNGGTLVASIEQTFGENIRGDASVDLYLLQPGGEPGSEETINTTLPVFRWDGPVNLKYRLLVVEDNGQGQSPESLLQAALSSAPILDQGMTGTGSLLEFEMVDAVIDNLTFTMPPSGVQELEAGKRYYWQVYTNRQTVSGTESIPSEIWEFSVTPDEENVSAALSQQVRDALQTLLGNQRYNQLRQRGFQFVSITFDGQTLEGAAALQKLQELSGELNNGDISIVIN